MLKMHEVYGYCYTLYLAIIQFKKTVFLTKLTFSKADQFCFSSCSMRGFLTRSWMNEKGLTNAVKLYIRQVFKEHNISPNTLRANEKFGRELASR